MRRVMKNEEVPVGEEVENTAEVGLMELAQETDYTTSETYDGTDTVVRCLNRAVVVSWVDMSRWKAN